jgi:HK97 family phage portal protein
MGFADLVNRFLPQRKTYSDSPVASILASRNNTGDSPRLMQNNMGDYLGKYADQAWVYACIRIIQSKAAGVPLRVYKRTGDDFAEIKDHPIQQLIESANPFMNGYDLLESTHGFIDLVGNAYWLLDVFVNGQPTEIYPLNPKCVKIKMDKSRGVVGYEYSLVPGIIQQTFLPEEIIHFKTWNPLDDFYGLAPLSAARDSSDMMMYSDQYNKNFFKNGAEPGGFLTSDQSIDEDSKKRIATVWKKIHQGVRKAHSVAILDGGLKFQSSASKNNEMQFVELKKMTREDVLSVYQIPPIMLGIEATYANAKEQRQIFWKDCIIPRLRKVESVLNERLVKPLDKTIVLRFDLSGIDELAEDADSRSRADSLNVAAGIVTINEVRKLKNLPEVPWGDVWYAPFGLTPVSSADSIPPAGTDEPAITPPTPPAKPAAPSDEPAKAKSGEEPTQPSDNPIDEQVVRRDAVWLKYKGLTERLENKWTPALRHLFNAQEREVINNLRDSDWKKAVAQVKLNGPKHAKQSIDVILFDRNNSRTEFRKMAHSLMTYTVGAAADDQINEYDLGIDFKLTDHRVTAWINSKSFKFAQEITQTTEDALRDELTQAINNGETISEVEDRIARVFDIARGARTAMIARTEVISASNEGAYESYSQSGIVDKQEWVSSRDNKVRDEHQIDGEVVSLGIAFTNGLLYPGDPSGEPSNVINCRCTIAPIVNKDGSDTSTGEQP